MNWSSILWWSKFHKSFYLFILAGSTCNMILLVFFSAFSARYIHFSLIGIDSLLEIFLSNYSDVSLESCSWWLCWIEWVKLQMRIGKKEEYNYLVKHQRGNKKGKQTSITVNFSYMWITLRENNLESMEGYFPNDLHRWIGFSWCSYSSWFPNDLGQ